MACRARIHLNEISVCPSRVNTDREIGGKGITERTRLRDEGRVREKDAGIAPREPELPVEENGRNNGREWKEGGRGGSVDGFKNLRGHK